MNLRPHAQDRVLWHALTYGGVPQGVADPNARPLVIRREGLYSVAAIART